MSVQNEFIPLIYDMIVYHLEDRSKNKEQSIEEASRILFDLNTSMDQFKENIMGLLVSEKKMQLFNDIDSTVKSAFTRYLNNMTQSSIKGVKKKTPGGGGSTVMSSAFGGSKFDPDI